jgi:hexulose-6-phosphate isomerase
MKRRRFLQRVGAGLAGTLAASTFTAGALPSEATALSVRHAPARVRKAVKLHMVEGDATTLEKFRLLQEIGFDGVELNSPNDLSREEVLAARDETGLPIHGVVNSVHWNKPLSDPDPSVREEGMAGMREALADAEAYGASTMLLVPAVVNEDVSYDAAYERSQAAIREVLPDAERHGVRIALENVWNNFLLSPLEFARYIDAFDSPWIGAYFDIGNIANFGWPAQWIRILGDRILKLDVKGYSRAIRDEQGRWEGFTDIGQGDIDWAAVTEALDDIGYDGWATAEVSGGDPGRLRTIARQMDQVLPVQGG